MAQNYKKYCIYAIDESYKRSFLYKKNSLEFLFEGDEFFIGAILPYFYSVLFIGLDRRIG